MIVNHVFNNYVKLRNGLLQLSKLIDKSLFCDDKSVNTLYGLPKDIKFCRSCVINNQRPSSSISLK